MMRHRGDPKDERADSIGNPGTSDRALRLEFTRYEDVVFPESVLETLGAGTVVLKPNISTMNPESFTSPKLIERLADQLSDLGKRVVIAEGMHLRKFKDTVLRRTGYADLIERYEFVDLEEVKCRLVPLGRQDLPSVAVPEMLFGDDVCLVNVPKLKTHLMTMLTCSVKNIAMGIVNQHSKAAVHRIAGNDFGLLCDLLLDIYLALSDRVSLTVVDAVRIMVGNGPSFGTKQDLGIVFVGETIATECAVVEELELPDYPLLSSMRRRGIPALPEVRGARPRVSLPDTYRTRRGTVLRRFLNPEYWSSILMGGTTIRSDWYSIEFEASSCAECGECLAHCPTGALTEIGRIDRALCSRCLCCVENCPRGAMRVRTSTRMRWLDRLGSWFYK
jgi:uncharacterized protein (DUF362 family)/ferredoxin